MYGLPIFLHRHTLAAIGHANDMAFGQSAAHVRVETDNVLLDLSWKITFSKMDANPLAFQCEWPVLLGMGRCLLNGTV